MFELPKKLDSFTPYEPLTGDYPVRLDVNESFIEIPADEVVRAVMEIGRVKLNRYPDPYATADVNAFAELFGVDSRCVTAGNGSDELIGLIMAGLLQKSDKVLTLAPDFSMYSFYAKLHELQVIELDKDEELEINVDEVIEYINQNDVKCLIFSNPCNPTSLGITKDEVERLADETQALIVVDEAYMDFWSDETMLEESNTLEWQEPESMLNEVQGYENLIVLRTCSKSSKAFFTSG